MIITRPKRKSELQYPISTPPDGEGVLDLADIRIIIQKTDNYSLLFSAGDHMWKNHITSGGQMERYGSTI